MPGKNESELIIRTLYEIAGEYDKGFEHQLERLLLLGLNRFDLDIGILSSIRDDEYCVVKQISPNGVPLNDGDTFRLGNTYCSITLSANGPVGFEHVARTDVSTHPAYQSFGLEAYIGVPVFMRGEVYGTLNFSSPDPRLRVFSEVDIDALQLMASWVGSELSRRRTEEELKEAKDELVQQSHEDALTHLYNRRGFEIKLIRLLKRSTYQNSALVAMLIDIDDFKAVNDKHGHSIGDRVLTAVAAAISDSLRPDDICGRIGGDEFMVLLPDCSVADAERVAERARSAVNALRITGAVTRIRPAVSIGLGVLPARIETVTDALTLLGAALQGVKQSGKNAASF